MTENEKVRELIATSETTVKVDPQNGWYLKRFAALQFEGSVDNFSTNMPIHVLEQQLPKEHHPTYRNMNRNYPGSVFLVGNQVHVMQGIAGSKDGEATTYKDTNANSIAAGKCKFVAKNSGILFV